MAPPKKQWTPSEAKDKGFGDMSMFFKVKRKPGRPKTKRNLAGDSLAITSKRPGRPPSKAKKDPKVAQKPTSVQPTKPIKPPAPPKK